MKINVLSPTGRKTSTLSLPREIFAVSASPQLISLALTAYLSNQRQATAKTKTRGEIKGSSRKIWRQKGTGRARHGDRYAPIFVGGGVTHGPKGNQNFKKRLTKKMKRKALFATLTYKYNSKQIFVLDGLEKLAPKTKVFAPVFNKILPPDSKTALLILPSPIQSIIRGARNLPFIEISQVSRLNIYEVTKNQNLIFTKDSLDVLKQVFLTKTPPQPQPQAKKPSLKPQPLSTRTLNLLKKARLSPSQAKSMSIEKLSAIKGLGSKAISEIKGHQ